ncbi:hypothetical protein B0A89_14385 (plasmid) [Paracoccus contaminans]|uniref:Uncharacterized protein n=1 Tax=Paracoccus contaminans TaxID=1945662 RepID=A0A1W6D1Q2_9RHOB|nr:hypothetical protein B0A89_14385 [Paracoccus contaminans]
MVGFSPSAASSPITPASAASGREMIHDPSTQVPFPLPAKSFGRMVGLRQLQFACLRDNAPE